MGLVYPWALKINFNKIRLKVIYLSRSTILDGCLEGDFKLPNIDFKIGPKY